MITRMLTGLIGGVAITAAVGSVAAHAGDDSWYKNAPIVSDGFRWQDNYGQTHEVRNGQDVVILSRMGNPCVSNMQATNGDLVCITAQDMGAIQQANAQAEAAREQARMDSADTLINLGSQMMQHGFGPAPAQQQQQMYCRMQANGVMRCDPN